MRAEAPALGVVVVRLEKVERQSRRLKMVGIVVIVLAFWMIWYMGQTLKGGGSP